MIMTSELLAEIAVLRTAPEPWMAIGDAEVHRLLTESPRDYFEHMLERLHDIAAGRTKVELPPKQVFPDVDSTADFRVMPCVTRSSEGVTKTVKLVGTNISQLRVPDQITVGKALVIDAIENYITHIVDACLLSSARTGMCATLAMHLLAPDARKIAIIGSGRVGYYSALYAVSCCNASEVTFLDRDPRRAATAAQAMSERFPALTCRSADAADIGTHDVVLLATTSETPPCTPQDWNAQLIISLGADIDHQSELDESWAGKVDLYVDNPDSARFGDLKKWTAKNHLKPGSIRQISDLLNSPDTRTGKSRQKLFISTGSALFDNLTLEYLLRRLDSRTIRRDR
ncbi:MAG: NAD(P)-binding domain-containing protein [Burkholderiales bacterium]